MTASAVQVTTCATTCRCLAASERTSSSLSFARASMCATIRSRDHAAKRVRRIAPSTSSTITSRLPRAHRVTPSSGAIAPINLALPSCDDAGRATKGDEMLRHHASLRPPGRCTCPAAAHGRQTDRSPYPLIGGLCPPPGSGRRRHGPNLDKQAQHIRLGETLDDTAAAEVQDGDAGQRDGRSARGYAHELVHVPAGHGEPDAGHVAVPQHLVELELRRVKGAEYPLVEAADLVLVHGLGGVAVQGDPLVVQGQVPVQVARVPALVRGRPGLPAVWPFPLLVLAQRDVSRRGPGDALHPGTTPVPGPDHPLPVRVRGALPAYFTCRGP